MPISEVINSDLITNTAVLLRDIHLVNRAINKNPVFQIEEKVTEVPSFLPYFYAIPRFNLKLNLVREISENQYEFGGLMGELPVSAIVQIYPDKILTKLTYLQNQDLLFRSYDVSFISFWPLRQSDAIFLPIA